MKTYVLTISKTFPTTHSKAGRETNFVKKINALSKLHTIRGNYQLWQKRFEKIAAGEACLSVRVWSGKPFYSKQIEVFNFKNTDGISVEELTFKSRLHNSKTDSWMTNYEDLFIVKSNMVFYGPNLASFETLAENDGLSLKDFNEWIRSYDLSKPMAVIQLTHLKYLKPIY